MNKEFTPLSSFLSEVLDYRGKTPKKLGSDWSKSGYRVLSANNVTHGGLKEIGSIRCVDEKTYLKWMKREIESGDILLTSEAPAGQIMLWGSEEKIVLGQRLFALRTKQPADGPFLKYYLQSTLGQKVIRWRTSGSTVSGISAKMFDHIPVVAKHSPSSRKKIGEILSILDGKIDLNNRITEELEGVAKSLYDYWFVQFDFPTTVAQAAAMGTPRLKGKPYRASGGKMIYNHALKRKIPKGWQNSTIGDAFKTYLGGTPSRENRDYWSPAEVNWLSSGENPSTFVVKPDERISKLGLQNSPAKLLPQGTVILSIVRHLRASILGIEAATNQSVVGIVETSRFKHCFIYPYLLREIPRLMVLRTGAQQPHINKGVLDESLLVVPDESTLEAYTSLAAPLFLQIKNFSEQNKELTELRDWLLPILMNGQVSVR